MISELATTLLVSLACVSHASCQATHLESPQYPNLARHSLIQGVVTVRAHLDSTGAVISTEVLGGNPLLAEEAKQNLSHWTFAPGQETTAEIVYEFRLEKPDVTYVPCVRVSFDLPSKVLVISNAPAPIRDGAIVRPKKH